jgi:hypothetical protein
MSSGQLRPADKGSEVDRSGFKGRRLADRLGDDDVASGGDAVVPENGWGERSTSGTGKKAKLTGEYIGTPADDHDEDMGAPDSVSGGDGPSVGAGLPHDPYARALLKTCRELEPLVQEDTRRLSISHAQFSEEDTDELREICFEYFYSITTRLADALYHLDSCEDPRGRSIAEQRRESLFSYLQIDKQNVPEQPTKGHPLMPAARPEPSFEAGLEASMHAPQSTPSSWSESVLSSQLSPPASRDGLAASPGPEIIPPSQHSEEAPPSPSQWDRLCMLIGLWIKDSASLLRGIEDRLEAVEKASGFEAREPLHVRFTSPLEMLAQPGPRNSPSQPATLAPTATPVGPSYAQATKAAIPSAGQPGRKSKHRSPVADSQVGAPSLKDQSAGPTNLRKAVRPTRFVIHISKGIPPAHIVKWSPMQMIQALRREFNDVRVAKGLCPTQAEYNSTGNIIISFPPQTPVTAIEPFFPLICRALDIPDDILIWLDDDWAKLVVEDVVTTPWTALFGNGPERITNDELYQEMLISNPWLKDKKVKFLQTPRYCNPSRIERGLNSQVVFAIYDPTGEWGKRCIEGRLFLFGKSCLVRVFREKPILRVCRRCGAGGEKGHFANQCKETHLPCLSCGEFDHRTQQHKAHCKKCLALIADPNVEKPLPMCSHYRCTICRKEGHRFTDPSCPGKAGFVNPRNFTPYGQPICSASKDHTPGSKPGSITADTTLPKDSMVMDDTPAPTDTSSSSQNPTPSA